MGEPYYGSFRTPLRAGESPCTDAHAETQEAWQAPSSIDPTTKIDGNSDIQKPMPEPMSKQCTARLHSPLIGVPCPNVCGHCRAQ
jgi:hypothetical protein